MHRFVRGYQNSIKSGIIWNVTTDDEVSHIMNFSWDIYSITLSKSDHEVGVTAPKVGIKSRIKRPPLYRVIILNDDFTPMEFVVGILIQFFHKSTEEAWRIMMNVHNSGSSECGVFTFEVAETKVVQVLQHSQKNHHPLRCVMEVN